MFQPSAPLWQQQYKLCFLRERRLAKMNFDGKRPIKNRLKKIFLYNNEIDFFSLLKSNPEILEMSVTYSKYYNNYRLNLLEIAATLSCEKLLLTLFRLNKTPEWIKVVQSFFKKLVTSFKLAIRNNNSNVVDILYQNANSEERIHMIKVIIYEPFIMAINNNNIDIINKLLIYAEDNQPLLSILSNNDYDGLKSLVAKRNVEILSIIWRRLPDDQKPIFESALNIKVTPIISNS